MIQLQNENINTEWKGFRVCFVKHMVWKIVVDRDKGRADVGASSLLRRRWFEFETATHTHTLPAVSCIEATRANSEIPTFTLVVADVWNPGYDTIFLFACR